MLILSGKHFRIVKSNEKIGISKIKIKRGGYYE